MSKKIIKTSAVSTLLSCALVVNGFLPGIPIGNTVLADTTPIESDINGNASGQMLINLLIKESITPGVSIDGWAYGEEPNEPQVSGNTGNGTVTYLYKVKGADDEAYTDKAPTAAGDYTVKAVIGETDGYKSGSATADFTIAPQAKTMTITLTIDAAEVTTAPTANDTLKYSGQPQALVTEGTASVGTMQYQLGTNSTTAPTGDWSDTVPSGTNADTYYVWYRAYVGEQNYSEAQCVEVSIAKCSVTLTSAPDTKVFDATELTNDSVTVTGDGFVTGATYDVTGIQLLPGESENTFTYELNDGTSADNYDITCVFGTLTVNKGVPDAVIEAKDLFYTGNALNLLQSAAVDPEEGGTCWLRPSNTRDSVSVFGARWTPRFGKRRREK